jgi:excisionase family DNA binding protein
MSGDQSNYPALISVQKAAEIRNCARSYIYVLIGRGQIRARKDGRKCLIETQSLLDDMASLPLAKIAPDKRASVGV